MGKQKLEKHLCTSSISKDTFAWLC